MATNDSKGGYKQERFANKVHPRFECPICFKIFKDPVQCPNQHHFCRSCIERCLLSSNKCPQCNCQITSETLQDVPRIVTEMLEDHDIRCKNANRGCPEIVKLQFLQRHEKNCGYSPTPCRNEGCNEVLNKNEIEDHERERCEFRLIDCEECKMKVVFKYRQSHSCFLRKEIDKLTKRLDMFEKSQNDRSKHVEEQVRLNRNEMVTQVEEQMKLSRDEMANNVEEQIKLNRNETATHVEEQMRLTRNEMAKHVEEQMKLNCDEMANNVEEQMKLNSNETATHVEEQMRLTRDEMVNHVEEQMKLNRDEMAKHVEEQVRLSHNEMTFLTTETTERCNFLTGKIKIFVCGGRDGMHRLNSVESFNWVSNCWQQEPEMNEERSGAAAFVHGREIFVCGGWNGKQRFGSIESLNMDGKLQWKISPVMLPRKCNGHSMIYNNDNVFMIGGYNTNEAFDTIYSIQLNPPHTTKLLAQIPEPRRYHGSILIGDDVLVFGGRIFAKLKDMKNTVYSYSLSKKECKTLAPLPYPVYAMSVVSYKGNVILIGGFNDKGEYLDKVLMYDVKTGQTKILPSLNHKRCGCSAVIIGNIIVVVGGYDKESYLDSIECLDMSTNVWRELPPMLTKRSFPAAVVSPIY